MMKIYKGIFSRAVGLFLVFTIICGVLYTGVVTVLALILFPHQANGSMIEKQGVCYGSTFMGQEYREKDHLWGRIMNLDVATYQNEKGEVLLYAAPANISPASQAYQNLVAERVKWLRETNKEMGEAAIPVDLVTCSGSGLDPEISPAAAEYQVKRIALASGKSEEAIRDIIARCTTKKFLGVFGEERVNVLKVNLMLEGIL